MNGQPPHPQSPPPDGSDARPEAGEPATADVRDVPAPPVTGDPVLDEATDRLAAVVTLPLEAQVEAYEHAHRALQGRLADVEG